MKNSSYCPNCNSENDFHSLNCSSCGALLRERVVNIDLWSTIWEIIETPSKAFKKITFAENKNYTFIIALFVSLKLTFNSFYLKSLFGMQIDYQNYLGWNLLIGVVTFLMFLMSAAFIQKKILRANKINTRFKDNFSAFTYSSVPLLLALFVFLPVEYALFGKYWIFFNPSPYLIKATAAYTFTGLEVLTIIWMIILFMLLGFVISKSKVYAIMSSAILVLLIGLISLFIPYL